MRPLLRILPYYKNYRVLMGLGYVAVVGNAFFNLAVPWLIGQGIDDGVVRHDVHTQHAQQSVVAPRRPAFEEGVVHTAAAHAEHDFVACIESVDHFLDDGDVVLQIGVERYDGITISRE